MTKISFGLILLLFLVGCKEHDRTSPVNNVIVRNGHVYYYMKGLEKPFNVLFLADTHFTVEDERGREFYKYSKRMGGEAVEPENYGVGNGRDRALEASLAKARETNCELVLLGGDIINFPSLASVERLKTLLDSSSLNWMYISGNHDWHYEGEPGKAFDQREKWINKHLKALYQGNNPMFSSQIIGGVNFIMIDNSTFEITPEQLEFLQEQIQRGIPILLSMHIPLYQLGHGVDYGCGNPHWCCANDCYYEVEHREPWPEGGCTEITRQFRECVIYSPEVIGVYAGHMHEKAIDFFNDKLQYVVDANFNNEDVLIHFLPVE
ncbi:metallophosphoesterase family protein [Parabacteroides sp.]